MSEPFSAGLALRAFPVIMGQNNDTTEHGDLQGTQGGNLSKNPAEHQRMRQPEEGYARAPEQRFKKPKALPQPGK